MFHKFTHLESLSCGRDRTYLQAGFVEAGAFMQIDGNGTLHVIAVLGSACIVMTCLVSVLLARSKSRRVITIIGLIEAGVFLDRIFNARWLLHNFVVRIAIVDNLYARRFGVQYLAITFVACAAVTGICLLSWHLCAQPAALLASLGALLSFCCWCIEVISLHAVDRLLYSPIDGLLPIRLAWASFALMTAIGVLWDAGFFTTTLPSLFRRATRAK